MKLIQLSSGEWAILSWTGGITRSPVFAKEKCTLRQIVELVKKLGVEDAVYELGERGCEQWAYWLIEHLATFEPQAA